MKRIAINYAQIQAIGHASMLDMRQFAYAGIPIYKEVADYMKVSQTELRSMISDGKVTADVIESVFKKMTSAGGTFYGSVDKGSQTYSARKQNLEDIKNIEKANIGQWGYRLGSSEFAGGGLGSSIMSLKESWHKGISDFFNGVNINSDYKAAEASLETLKRIEIITGNIDKKVQPSGNGSTENNNFLTEDTDKTIEDRLSKLDAETRKIISSYLNIDYDKYRSAISNKIEMNAGLQSSNVVSEEDRDNIKKARDSYIKSVYPELYGKSQTQIEQLKGSENNNLRNIANAYLFTDKTVATLNDLYENTMSFSEYFGKINTVLKQTPYKSDSIWEMETLAGRFASKNSDMYKKFTTSENAGTKQSANYKLLYESSSEGKKEKKKTELEEYNSYSKSYDTAKSIFDEKNGWLNFSAIKTTKNMDNLYDIVKQGFFDVTGEIKINRESFNGEEGEKNWTTLRGKVNSILSNTDITSSNAKTLGSLRSMQDVLKRGITDKNISSLASLYSQTMGFAGDSGDDNLKASVGSLLLKFGMAGKSKFASTDKGKDNIFIPLWKRIFGSATGINASTINTNSYGAMMNYIPFMNRSISQGGINGMASSGMSAKQIADNLIYENRTNGTNARQIDWNKTSDNMLKSVLS